MEKDELEKPHLAGSTVLVLVIVVLVNILLSHTTFFALGCHRRPSVLIVPGYPDHPC